MPQFDLPRAALETYRATSVEPSDLDAFWDLALAQARAAAAPARRVPYRTDVYGGRLLVEDITFSGGEGHPIRAWFIAPRDAAPESLACRVTFVGYGGGRGLPLDHTAYAAAGHAVLVMDSRAQGGEWAMGATGDPAGGSSSSEHPGVMTRGIADPRTYYYRRLYVDAVRAVETAAEHPLVDPARIGVAGHSQGGGLAIAAAALRPELVRLCHAGMPFLCGIRRSLEVAGEPPYTELVEYLRLQPQLSETALATLDYIDCAHLAPRVRARSLWCVGLMDQICPPSGIFAAFNALSAEKALEVFPWSEHEIPQVYAEHQLADFAAEMTLPGS
jgi:cephalosporin-C deacetylase